MAVEIERKFLVASAAWRDNVDSSVAMVQGYIAETETCSIRVRVAGDRAWISFKGLTIGARRSEFEYAVPADEAREMLALYCGGRVIEKTRHHLRCGDHTWEIDEFDGANTGLIVAEVELECEDEQVSLPAWVGEEVTHDPRYYNIRLVTQPFSEWFDD